MGSMRGLAKVPYQLDELLPEQLDAFLDSGRVPLTDETTCGYGIFRGKCLQSLASKKSFVVLYGTIGLLFSAMFSYFNGTISTLEKLFKIPSRNSGIIMVGNDIGSLFLSSFLGYYCANGHRPRWISFGVITFAVFCLMNAAPHFLYGVGPNVMQLTVEHRPNVTDDDGNLELCHRDGIGYAQCDLDAGRWAPQVILFVSQLIAGIGQTLFNSLGSTYMDDNVQKNKLPSMFSIGIFMRLIGSAIGFTLASELLKIYIEPGLTPTITQKDPRWLGAWWVGWVALSIPILLTAFVASLFPRSLPRAAVRKAVQQERDRRTDLLQMSSPDKQIREEPQKQSVTDMMATFKRLVSNPIFMLTTFSFVFYSFGYAPYWSFGPKYLEVQYHLTASQSSRVLGTLGLVFSALGVILSGFVITRYRPSAKQMAAWNTFVGVVTVMGLLGYTFLGCEDTRESRLSTMVTEASCSQDCHCDYVSNAPVCGDDGRTYISACHAGCTTEGGVFGNCSCVATSTQTAAQGSCPVECVRNTILFIGLMCLIKFVGSTARATNFLIAIRCVPEADKSASMGMSTLILSVCSFVPSPIFFGYIIDQTCIVWGHSCFKEGNCWLYDRDSMRWMLNTICASLIAVCIIIDFVIWWKVGDLQMFEEDTITNDCADEKILNEYGKNSSENELQLQKGRQFSRRTSDVVLMERRGSLNL